MLPLLLTVCAYGIELFVIFGAFPPGCAYDITAFGLPFGLSPCFDSFKSFDFFAIPKP